MLYRSEEDFAKSVKGETPGGVYLLYGNESYLIESWAKRLTGAFGGDFASFNLQRLDGRRLNCDALLDAVETLPLMASEKCVLVDDLDLKGLPADGQDKLLEAVRDLPPGVALVITGKPGVFDPKSAAGKKLVQMCSEAGAAVELSPRGTAGLTRFLRGEAKKRGCELPPDLARYLLEICGNDMTALSNEIAKVCAYCGGGTVTREQVDAVATPRTEARAFDLAKAIQARNPQRALEILDGLFYLREQPVAILSALSLSYCDLYRIRAAKDGGKTPADVVAAFGYKGREFRVNNAWNTRLSPETLRASLAALLDCDRRLKSTGVDGRILLEQAVVRLFAIQGRG